MNPHGFPHNPGHFLEAADHQVAFWIHVLELDGSRTWGDGWRPKMDGFFEWK